MTLLRAAARLATLALALLTVSACASAGATGPLVTPRPEASPTATAVPTVLPTEMPTQIAAGGTIWRVSSEMAGGSADAAGGDPVEGERLFSAFNARVATRCSACHRADSDDRLVGPGLLHVGERAQTRVPGLDAAAYIRQSILDPSAYVVEGYPNLMPKNWRDGLTDSQIDDLIAYLIRLGQSS